MHILIINNTVIPVKKYGGTERVIWYLGKELISLGHKVSYLVKKGSYCSFATIYCITKKQSLNHQITEINKKNLIDMVHIHFNSSEIITFPHLFTIHVNGQKGETYPINTVFISKNHAMRYGSSHYVYNGIDWEEYPAPDLNLPRNQLAFLADIKRPEKNLSESLKIAKLANKRIVVMGGWKLNFNSQIKYYGMVNNFKKGELLAKSEALLFPILWDEPFGLAPIESLYYGCPVIGTEFGSLPELILPKGKIYGILSNNKNKLLLAVNDLKSIKFNPQILNEYARNYFSHKKMTKNYLKYYQKVIKGKFLHSKNHPPLVKKNSDRNHLYHLD